ncbi:MAG: RNA polymerase sigma factor [Bacteroidales bacterium]|nr:RNA polymerase sigma factor [Bacteroidales bacterium]
MDYSRFTKSIRKGDREVFRDYMDSTIDIIYRLVFIFIARHDDTNDIVQETFIKVWEKRKTLRSDKSIMSWTKKIAINKSYDYLRKQSRTIPDSDDKKLADLISGIEADDNIKDEEYHSILHALTGMLSPRQKLVFTLSVIEKLSADEIAEITGLSKTSIKSNLYHSRKTVQKNAERIM